MHKNLPKHLHIFPEPHMPELVLCRPSNSPPSVPVLCCGKLTIESGGHSTYLYYSLLQLSGGPPSHGGMYRVTFNSMPMYVSVYQFEMASCSVCIADGHFVFTTGGWILLYSCSITLHSLSILYEQRETMLSIITSFSWISSIPPLLNVSFPSAFNRPACSFRS